MFHPDSIKRDENFPKLYFTGFKIFNKDVPIGLKDSPLKKHISETAGLILSYKHSVFTLEYAAINFSHPEKTQYAYHLEGFEDEWNYVGAQRAATYTNLDAGEYIFRVKSTNNDGVWNEEGISLKIKILPPWWGTWGFRILMVLLILGTAIVGYWRRVTSVERLNRMLTLKINERTADLKNAKEAAEAAKEAAEAANRAKSEFISNMSHEIRTPMNAIFGFTGLLENQIQDSRLTYYLKAIKSSGKSLLTLINDILDLSKMEAGKVNLEYSVVEPQSVFKEMEQIFSQKIAEKNLNFLVEIDSNLPGALLLDEIRLRQILLNLVGNAIKFTDSGYVRLSVEMRYPQKDQSSLDLIFSVEDTGTGIAEDQLETIFGAFEQQKGQSHALYGGTGLGLAITKRLVDLMGGESSVESETGKGSKFTVLLKDVEVASLSEKIEEEEEIDLTKITFEPATIFVVDDVQLNRDLLKGYLSNFGFRIIEAVNGKECVDLAWVYQPDLILMDIKMPVMDGVEAARMIKADEALSHTAVIAVSAVGSRPEEEKLKGCCDAYLRKPVSQRELINELMKFLPHTVESTAGEAPGLAPGEGESVPGELPGSVREKLPELLKIIEEKIENARQNWDALTMDEIEALSLEIKTLGEIYHYPPLITWANRLHSQAQLFDIASLKATFGEVPTLLQELKSLI